jgi:hypothetical protein
MMGYAGRQLVTIQTARSTDYLRTNRRVIGHFFKESFPIHEEKDKIVSAVTPPS